MRRGFTLIEMLVVMAIGMILMGLTASAYQNIKTGQDLGNGAATVQGALQTARAQAMQLNKVVRVYFLDGGLFQEKDAGVVKGRNFHLTVGGVDNGEDADAYLRAYTSYDVPYELLAVTSDGQELAKSPLPNGVAWLTLGSGGGIYPSDTATYNFAVEKEFGLQELRRNCSLIICFGPTGSAWAEAAPKRLLSSSPAVGSEYQDTTKYLRVFMLDDLSTPKTFSDGSGGYMIEGDLWDTNGSNEVINTAPDLYEGSSSTHKKPREMLWKTVVMNYTTGIADLVDGKSEP